MILRIIPALSCFLVIVNGECDDCDKKGGICTIPLSPHREEYSSFPTTVCEISECPPPPNKCSIITCPPGYSCVSKNGKTDCKENVARIERADINEKSKNEESKKPVKMKRQSAEAWLDELIRSIS